MNSHSPILNQLLSSSSINQANAAIEAMDVFNRTSKIMERANIAMGINPPIRIENSSSANVKLK